MLLLVLTGLSCWSALAIATWLLSVALADASIADRVWSLRIAPPAVLYASGTSVNAREFRCEWVTSCAHWNHRLVSQTRPVNPQAGDFQAVSFERLRDQVLAIRGQPQLEHGPLLQSPMHRIAFWYSAVTGRRVGLDADVKGGRVLTYRPSPSTSESAP